MSIINPFHVLSDQYELLETIGKGGFAKVKLAIHLLTGEKVAIKIMEKKKLGHDLHRVDREIAALRVLDHPSICRLLQCIDTETHIFLVLEYCPGGELFDYVVDRDRIGEDEARKFFRQIVAAMAYVHCMGYAHRDLKPENLLLDEKQRIKLIDFGLCAKPKGGMMEHLDTCCGSPAYAAPELITGKAYLGAEADVWSMGVLLYALLCGTLPFDDQLISQLYHKITRGQYKTPNWLSADSRSLIACMLQVEPEKRITVRELCRHPWLTKGVSRPVTWKHTTTRLMLDKDCLNAMARLQGETASKVAENVEYWKFDSSTALYLLLQKRKLNGLPLLFLSAPSMNSPAVHVSLEGGLNNCNLLSLGTPPSVHGAGNVTPIRGEFAEPRLPSPRKHRRIRSPGLTDVIPNEGSYKLSPARSVDTGLQNLTPVRSTWSSSGGNKEATPRRVLGSLERGLHRVRHILTPRAKRDQQPAVLSSKRVCNVSTTASDCPDQVLAELRRALIDQGMSCRQTSGYTLQGKKYDMHGKVQLSFELEVCVVGPTRLVGIRRKRLRGDAWCYKRVCERILGLAAQPTKIASVK